MEVGGLGSGDFGGGVGEVRRLVRQGTGPVRFAWFGSRGARGFDSPIRFGTIRADREIDVIKSARVIRTPRAARRCRNQCTRRSCPYGETVMVTMWRARLPG